MILFCLPYAGGSTVTYYKWKYFLEPSIELRAIELRGRGERFNEEFNEDLNEAVEDIFQNIKDGIIDDEYAIYGHSMGALLAYELYYKINKESLELPKHIFFSGYKPPNIVRNKKGIYLLPDDQFIKEIIAIGGTTKEVENNQEWIQLFIPILRNDFKMLEQYDYKKKKDKIQCDISILNGKEDEITMDDILEWKNHGKKRIEIYNLEGNHFFINDNVRQITEIINKTLIR